MNKKIFLFTMLVVTIYVSGCSVEIDPKIANTAFGLKALNYEFLITLIALLGGYACVIAGFVLTVMGFTGSIEWVVETTTFTSKVTNASPGVILMIIGAYIVTKSKLDIYANITVVTADELKEKLDKQNEDEPDNKTPLE